MNFTIFQAAILASLCAVFSFPSALVAEEADVQTLIEATFVVTYGEQSSGINNAFKFKSDFERLGGKALEQIDFPETGATFLSGNFTLEQIEVLEELGNEATLPVIVSLFEGAECGRPTDIPEHPERAVPENVCRVVGNRPDADLSHGPVVWILDSGLDEDVADKFLNVIPPQVDCTRGGRLCTDSALTIADDTVGHGTMVAGIVGGANVLDQTSNVYSGLAGVSPKAQLRIVKVFKRGTENIFKAPLKGLRYVVENAKAGDIVNISWGGNLLSNVKKRKYSRSIAEIDEVLHYLADKQIRVVIAAGNAAHSDEMWPWVRDFFPAGSATYRSNVVVDRSFGAGAIYSVSAADSQNSSGTTWVDDLWPGSAFGASYAEPGVSVRSYWFSTRKKDLQQNVCSGTSFAAPALAGLLVQADRPSSTAQTRDSPYRTAADLVGYQAVGHSRDPDTDHPKCD